MHVMSKHCRWFHCKKILSQHLTSIYIYHLLYEFGPLPICSCAIMSKDVFYNVFAKEIQRLLTLQGAKCKSYLSWKKNLYTLPMGFSEENVLERCVVFLLFIWFVCVRQWCASLQPKYLVRNLLHFKSSHYVIVQLSENRQYF